MEMSEQALGKADEIVIKGRVFKPVYKHLFDNIPCALAREMARRRLDELEAGKKTEKNVMVGMDRLKGCLLGCL